jgi:tetratricopeptide (TPR) repeat protein/O-antigen ligase
MPNHVEHPWEELPRVEHTRPAWVAPAVALLPVVACFLGGATEKWSEGIVVALLGLLLIFDPPRHSLGPLLNGILIALLAGAALSFLPAHWFYTPSWRRALINDFGIELSPNFSPQPWITLGCLISFFAGLTWFYYVCVQEAEMRDVRFQVRIFAGGIVFLAAISILLYAKGSAPPFWHNERGFGPFPNRNQTGDLFGITAVMLLASGQDHFRRGKVRWFLSALGFALIVAALIINFSRAGILILIGGSAIWITAMAFRQASPARIAIGLSTVLILLTTLLIFGGPTLERFHLRGAAADGISTDFRWLIFRDAWRLILASPWCGIGLGNFEPVFAISRIASSADTRSLHPESDWLWLWSELGWPAVLLTVIAITVLIPRVFPLREGTNQRIRLAALIAAIIFTLHGLIDVSAHRVGTAFAGIFLFGAALYRPFHFRPSRSLPIIFRIVGLGLFAAGTTWLMAARYQWALPGSLGAETLRESATIMNRSRNFDETIALTTRALGWVPLDWRLYFGRALGKLGARKEIATAVDDFRRARFLEPNAYEVPFEEGIIWLTNQQPTLAITAWREALRRAGPRRLEIYGEMFFKSGNASPFVIGELAAFATNQPELIIAGLNRVPVERFSIALNKFLEIDPDLHAFTPEEKKNLLSLWAERGDSEQFFGTAKLHPDWQSAAWEGLARNYASKKDFRAAVDLMRQFAPAPPFPSLNDTSSGETLQKQFYADPNNFSVGFALYREQMREGKIDDALATARHFTSQPDCPAYFYFLEMESWLAKANWERAWNAWIAFEHAGKK